MVRSAKRRRPRQYRSRHQRSSALGGADTGTEDAGKLKPETAQSYEGGLKVRALQGRVEFETDVFLMDFENLVTATTIGGLPALMNTGAQRFQGIEFSTDVRLRSSLLARSSYSFHDAQFTDFAQLFDGVLTPRTATASKCPRVTCRRAVSCMRRRPGPSEAC
jgi:outer membrane receptor protein involved in Fe transport